MSSTIGKNFGQIAYEAYCNASRGISLVTGTALPPWPQLRPEIQSAWIEAGDDAVQAYIDRQKT